MERPRKETVELVAALREVADFYERHPLMPVPKFPELLVGIDAPTDHDGAAVVSSAAKLLGVEMLPPGVPVAGARHYSAEGWFGPRDGRLYPALGLRVYYVPQPAAECERVS